jgi:hypothetical protein
MTDLSNIMTFSPPQSHATVPLNISWCDTVRGRIQSSAEVVCFGQGVWAYSLAPLVSWTSKCGQESPVAVRSGQVVNILTSAGVTWLGQLVSSVTDCCLYGLAS